MSMINKSMLVALILSACAAPAMAQEQPVEPYAMSNANAGAKPIEGAAVYAAFHGKQGVARIVDGFVDRNVADPRISDIFKNQDMVRLRRTLNEQFCYILGGGCDYTGRDMKAAHKDMGIQTADMGALVENLQVAMDAEKVPTWAQNRLLARLAPMKSDILQK